MIGISYHSGKFLLLEDVIDPTEFLNVTSGQHAAPLSSGLYLCQKALHRCEDILLKQPVLQGGRSLASETIQVLVLDIGCLWGGELTALRIDPFVLQFPCPGQQDPAKFS